MMGGPWLSSIGCCFMFLPFKSCNAILSVFLIKEKLLLLIFTCYSVKERNREKEIDTKTQVLQE